MGARTDAARAEVVARRQLLLDEVVGLEAAGRPAVDIPGQDPPCAGQDGGARRRDRVPRPGRAQADLPAMRRAVLGPKADLPKSMLPKQIDKALRSLGDDGEQVRGSAGARVRVVPGEEPSGARGAQPEGHDLRAGRQRPPPGHRRSGQAAGQRAVQPRRAAASRPPGNGSTPAARPARPNQRTGRPRRRSKPGELAGSGDGAPAATAFAHARLLGHGRVAEWQTRQP